MKKENKEAIEKLKETSLALEEQIKLLVRTEIELRRTQAELVKSKAQMEEYNRTLEQKIGERTKELNESGKRFKDIALSMADWIWEIDKNGGYTYCSEKIKDIVGYTAEEMIGKTPYDFMTPEEAARVKKIIAHTVQNKGIIKDMENWHIAKDGRRVCLLTNGVLLWNEKGELTGYRGVDKDITAQKMAEVELNLNEQKFHSLFDNMNEGVALHEIVFSGGKPVNYRVIDVNDSFSRIFGIPRGQISGKLATEAYGTSTPPFFEEYLNASSNKKPLFFEAYFEPMDKHFAISAVPWLDNGFAAIFMDIGERKKAEQALRESEERFRSYIENAPSGVFTLDINGRFLEANKSACRMVGFSEEEIKRMGIEDLLAEESLEDGQAYFSKLVETGAATSGPLWHRHKDGAKRCLTIDAVKLSKGWALGFCNDMTEKKLAEDRLQESEKKYREFVETLQEGIWAIDKDTITTFVNSRMAQILGYTVEEMIGKSMFYFTDEKGADILKVKLSNRAHGISEQYENTYVKKNGERLLALISVSPIMDENGLYLGAQGSVQDITLRKKLEKEVMLEATIEKGLTDISREITANTTLNINYTLSIIANVFNFDKGYMFLAKIEDEGANKLCEYGEFFPGNAQSNLKNKQQVAETGIQLYIKRFGYVANPLVINNVEDETSHLLKDERKFLETHGIRSTMVIPVYHRKPLQKNLIAVIGFEFYDKFKVWNKSEVKFIQAVGEMYAVDYERRYSMNMLQKAHDELEDRVKERTKDLREANEKLKELDKIKSEFLSTMSHEFRTPLTSIKAFTEILLKNPGEDKKQQTEFLEIISSENERLTRLIDDFLDLSKIESGRIEWNMEKLNIEEILNSTVEKISEVAKKNNIVLETRIEAGLPLITGDRDRLVQVIMNLLSNAVKFTPENGNIYVGARVREGFVEAFVSDSGIGIAPEHKEAVFERFKQISYVQSGKPKGTGLGLAICKEIIEYHKGKIWVESPPPPPDGQEGKGSVFYFTLPFA